MPLGTDVVNDPDFSAAQQILSGFSGASDPILGATMLVIQPVRLDRDRKAQVG